MSKSRRYETPVSFPSAPIELAENMQFAIASEQEYEDQDEVYHYVREGTNLTLCGLEIHYKENKEPGGMRLCIRCKRAYSKMHKT